MPAICGSLKCSFIPCFHPKLRVLTAAAQRERGARANEQRGQKFQSKRRPAGHVRNTAHKRDTASKLSGINKGKRKGKGGGRRG